MMGFGVPFVSCVRLRFIFVKHGCFFGPPLTTCIFYSSFKGTKNLTSFVTTEMGEGGTGGVGLNNTYLVFSVEKLSSLFSEV